MSSYPDDNPEVLERSEQRGYEEAKNLAAIVAFLCEDCADMLARYQVNTTIAMPKIAERYHAGFMRAWRELHATFKKVWPYA